MKMVIGIFLALSMLACGQQQSSLLDGHYENSSESDMEVFAYGQSVVPEYAPSRGVVVSSDLFFSFGREDLAKAILDAGVETLWVTVPSYFNGNLESSKFKKLRKTLGADLSRVQLVKHKTRGQTTVWARDWAPLGAKSSNGQLRLLDFNYYSDRDADDVTPQSMGDLMNWQRVSVPVYNEGGNFMNNSQGTCLMTTRVNDANKYRETSGDMILDEDQIINYYQRFAGCKSTVIFPRMPYEGTGHIDMWAKFLDDNTVIVGQLDESIKDLYKSSSEKNKVQNLVDYLEARANDIAGLGFKVIRIPMPAPHFGFYEVFRSYTNSLTVNGTAIIPRYVRYEGRSFYLDDDAIDGMESEVAQIYSSLGYKIRWINSDELISNGGAVHCTTMQIPR